MINVNHVLYNEEVELPRYTFVFLDQHDECLNSLNLSKMERHYFHLT